MNSLINFCSDFGIDLSQPPSLIPLQQIGGHLSNFAHGGHHSLPQGIQPEQLGGHGGCVREEGGGCEGAGEGVRYRVYFRE